MWFNNIIAFEFQTPFKMSADEIKDCLTEHRIKSCPPHARQTSGFTNLLNTDEELCLYTLQGCHVVLFAEEKRLLPASVLKDALDEKLIEYEHANGKPMRRSERLKLKEELEFDLLPKAFTISKKEWLYIDTLKQWIIVNTSNINRAADIVSALRKALGTLNVVPLNFDSSLSLQFAEWLKNPRTLPGDLYFGRQCELISTREDKSKFVCKSIENAFDEIHTLLEQGLTVSSIELVWQERMRFVLTDNFIIKRIKCIEYLDEALRNNGKLEHAHEKLDADLALLTGEVRGFLADLLNIFKDSIVVEKVEKQDEHEPELAESA